MNPRSAWTDGVSRWLIHGAARRAPDALSDRLEEEWLADLDARPTGTSRLRFAIGCCWATRVIAHEYEPAIVRVAGTSMAPKLAQGSVHFNLGRFSRGSTIAFLVVTLHVGLFYVLIAKLSHTHFNAPPPPFKVAVIDEPTPKLTSPPIDINFAPPVISPEVPKHVEIGPDEDTSHLLGVVGEPLPPVETAPPQQREISPQQGVQRTQGGPGAGFPNAEDFYPDSAKRLGEQGMATVQVCVDAKGRLTSEPATLQSTGSARLDRGALNLARAASGHYRASTEDGRPVSSCYPFRIRFQLRN